MGNQKSAERYPLPEVVIPDQLTMSHSLIKEWRTCRRKFFFHYMARLDAKRISIPFLVGSSFHSGVEAFYDGRPPEDFVPEIIKAMREKVSKAVFLTPEDEQKLMMQESIVTGMLRGYAHTYASDLKRWKIAHTEHEFQIPIIENRMSYVGQIDLVIRQKDGRLWIVEHKTAGRIDRNYVERLALDTQVTGYAIGARHSMNEPIAGIIYNVAKKPQIRQRKDESPEQFATRVENDYLARPEFYFYREELLRDVSATVEYKKEVAEIAADLEQVITRTKNEGAQRALPQYYRNTDACTAKGPCPYLPICTRGWNEDTQRLYKVRTKLNPELDTIEPDDDESGGD